MALTDLAPDEIDRPEPMALVDLDRGSGVIRRYGTRDHASLPTFYDGRIRAVELSRQTSDALWAPVTIWDFTITLINEDGELTPDYVAGYQGNGVTLSRYDLSDSLRITLTTGVVSRARIGRGVVTLEGTSLDESALEQEIPKGIVDTAQWPLAKDVGAVIPVIFGTVPKVPLPYVRDDTAGSQFDFLVGRGTLAVTAVYRSWVNETIYALGFGEFTRAAGGAATSWAEVARTDLYPGYTAIRVTLRPVDYNNALHKFWADVTGFAAERNHATAVKTLLDNTSYGLSQTVDVTSFATATAALNTDAPNVFCDLAMLEARPARDWLRELLMVRGMRLGINGSGAWTLTVDRQATTRWPVARDIPGQHPTLIAVGERETPGLEDTVRDLVIKYRWDHLAGRYLFEQRREVNAGKGRDRIFELPAIRGHEAADRAADYIGKRLLYGQDQVDVTLPQEYRQLLEGGIVPIHDPTIGYASPTDMEARSIAPGALTAIRARLQGWSENIFTYTPGSLPADEVSGTENDFSRTAPSAPSVFGVNAQGTVVGGDGKVSAFIVLNVTNPTSNFARTHVRYRRTGTTEYQLGTLSLTAGATTVRIEGLQPAVAHDYQAQTENAFGLLSGTTGLSNVTSATDASVPAAPSAIAVRQSGAKVVEIVITAAPPSDWGTTRLYRATVNNFASATEITHGKKLTFHDENVSYLQTYYYWARIEDTSGNLGAVSPSVAHSITVAQIVTGDVGDSQITTPKIPDSGVTTGKIATGAVTTRARADLGAGSVGLTDASGIVTVLSCAITTAGGDVIITGSFYVAVSNTGASAFITARGYLYRDGIQLSLNPLTGGGPCTNTPPTNVVDVPFAIAWQELPSSGAHTYSLRVSVSGNAVGGVSGVAQGASIALLELKR